MRDQTKELERLKRQIEELKSGKGLEDASSQPSGNRESSQQAQAEDTAPPMSWQVGSVDPGSVSSEWPNTSPQVWLSPFGDASGIHPSLSHGQIDRRAARAVTTSPLPTHFQHSSSPSNHSSRSSTPMTDSGISRSRSPSVGSPAMLKRTTSCSPAMQPALQPTLSWDLESQQSFSQANMLPGTLIQPPVAMEAFASNGVPCTVGLTTPAISAQTAHIPHNSPYIPLSGLSDSRRTSNASAHHTTSERASAPQAPMPPQSSLVTTPDVESAASALVQTAVLSGQADVLSAALNLISALSSADNCGGGNTSDRDIFRLLGRRRILDSTDGEGCTPLQRALWAGRSDLAGMLIDAGAEFPLVQEGA